MDLKSRLLEVEGIGEAKAQAIIDAGFDTIEKIKKASVEELSGVRGVSQAIAESIKLLEGGEEVETEEREIDYQDFTNTNVVKAVTKEVETEEQEIEKIPEVEAEIVEGEEEVYLVKAKPKLPEGIVAKLRDKKKVPDFKRQEWFRYRRLDTSYRRPKGLHSKARKHLRYRPPIPRIGYRTQAEIRGLHPSGFREVMVYRPKDLESMDPGKEAARIGSTVGGRKRENIIELADKRGIRILNRW